MRGQGGISNIMQQVKYTFAGKPEDLDSLPRGFEGSNQSYQKFILLGHQRSGSSMIIGTLREHSRVLSFGELFKEDSVGFNVTGYDNQSSQAFSLRNKYPVEFLTRYIYSSYHQDIQAVGFKFFPEHVQRNKKKFTPLWQWLQENKDVKVIDLKRENLLAAYVSLLIAIKDGRFSIKDEAERSTRKLFVDPKKCLAEFEERKTLYEEAKQYVRHHDRLEVSYEDLSADIPGHLKEIQEFIGVDNQPLEVRKVKQETRPLTEIIENYSELEEFFRDTEWAYLFDM